MSTLAVSGWPGTVSLKQRAAPCCGSRAAAAGSGSAKIALPATRMSTPAMTAAARGVELDPSVDLDLDGQPGLVDRTAGDPDLVEDVRDERLTPEARMDAHDEQQVDLAEERQDRVDRRRRTQGQPHSHTTRSRSSAKSGRGSPTSMWTMQRSAPASAKSARSTAGLSTIR